MLDLPSHRRSLAHEPSAGRAFSLVQRALQLTAGAAENVRLGEEHVQGAHGPGNPDDAGGAGAGAAGKQGMGRGAGYGNSFQGAVRPHATRRVAWRFRVRNGSITPGSRFSDV